MCINCLCINSSFEEKLCVFQWVPYSPLIAGIFLFCYGRYLMMFVGFLLVFDDLLILFRIACWTCTGKELLAFCLCCFTLCRRIRLFRFLIVAFFIYFVVSLYFGGFPFLYNYSIIIFGIAVESASLFHFCDNTEHPVLEKTMQNRPQARLTDSLHTRYTERRWLVIFETA